MNEISNVLQASLPTPTEDSDTKVGTGAHTRLRLRVLALQVLLGVAIVGSWELSSRLGWVDSFFYGQPSGVVSQLWDWIVNGTSQGPLWDQILATLKEAVYGFLLGVAVGVVFGVLLGRIRLLSDILAPYIKVANSIPRVVLASIFIISLGLGTPSKVATAFVLVFFSVFFNAFQGVREVDRNLLANARILGANEFQLVTNVVLPSALTWIIASLHVSFGFALVGAIVGEVLGANEGLGLMITTAQNTFNPNGVFAGMFILAVIALVAEALITALENRLIHWRPNTITEVSL